MIDRSNAKEEGDFGDYFMIFYYQGLTTTREYLDIIEKRAAKLVSLSENLAKWETCAYGNVISFCNSESLKAVRECWVQYCHKQNSNNDRRKEMMYHASNYVESTKVHIGHVNLPSAFGALSLKSIDDATFFHTAFWESAFAPPEEYCPNPISVYSSGAGSKHSLSRGCDPYIGFHLASSHSAANLSTDSPFRNIGKDHSPDPSEKTKSFELAGYQFRCWCESFRTSVRNSRAGKSSLKIRIFVGDPCAFSFALDRLRTNSSSKPLDYYRQPWLGQPLKLDGSAYTGHKKFPSTPFVQCH